MNDAQIKHMQPRTCVWTDVSAMAEQIRRAGCAREKFYLDDDFTYCPDCGGKIESGKESEK